MIYRLAMRIVTRTIQSDPALYEAWQRNISQAFLDRLKEAGYRIPGQKVIAYLAAQDFLDNLIR